LDDERFRDDRIVLVGHSHGGNVCLAAAGKCRRKIDVAVCLATPIFHLRTMDERKQGFPLPVYCSPESRRNIGLIVTVSAGIDPVVEIWADLRKGIDDQTAVDETREWQRLLNYPRLAEDGGPIRELVGDVLGLTQSGNLVVSSGLACADHNVRVASDVQDLSTHDAVHSCRMGQILGAVLRDGCSEGALNYLSNVVLPAAGSDNGDPVPMEERTNWWKTHTGNHSGWVLKTISVESRSIKRPNGKFWDFDKSRPDLRVRIVSDGRTVYEAAGIMDEQSMKCSPFHHIPIGTKISIEIWDHDLVAGDYMGEIAIDSTQSRTPLEKHECDAFDASMEWVKGHH